MSMTDVLVIRIPKKLKKMMKSIPINWPEYIRRSIREKIRKELMKTAAARLDTIRKRLPRLNAGTIAEWIREDREHI